MFKINKDESMELNQGDICNFALSFYDYKIEPKDKLIFVVKNNDTTVIKKDVYKIVDGIGHFKLDNNDTINLNIGTYDYYIAIKPYNMESFNILSNREFIIKRGVVNEL